MDERIAVLEQMEFTERQAGGSDVEEDAQSEELDDKCTPKEGTDAEPNAQLDEQQLAVELSSFKTQNELMTTGFDTRKKRLDDLERKLKMRHQNFGVLPLQRHFARDRRRRQDYVQTCQSNFGYTTLRELG
ncbi:unnamed protein product, partial [Mesorhabditis spiculigera]